MAIRSGASDSGYASRDIGSPNGWSDGTTSGQTYAHTAYIPELFANKMLVNFFEVTLWTSLANTDYQGEIKNQGDKVWMATTPDISINDYVTGTDLTYETPNSAPRELLIDQGLSWGYKIDDVDQVQTHLNLLNAFAAQAAEKMAQAVDINILKYITVGDGTTSASAIADSDNFGTAAGAISGSVNLGAEYTTASGDNALAPTGAPTAVATDMVNYIVDANLVLDEQNISKQNRWIVLPAWACSLLKKGELRRADITGDSTGVIRNGLIGEVDGMQIYRSNNVYHATEDGGTGDDVELFYCPFGTKEGLTFASQLTKTESVRLEKQFGDAYRGLNIFGRAVSQPTAIGMMIMLKA